MQTAFRDSRAMRRYLAILGVGVVLVVGAIAVMNATMDPFGVYRGFGEGTNVSPRAGIGSRIGMAERLRQQRFDTALIGTSRVAAGISEHSFHLSDRRTINLGMPAANFFETGPILRYAITEGEIKRVQLFLDFYQFTSRSKGDFDFSQSRFNPESTALDYHCDKLVGWMVTRLSIRAIRNRWKGVEKSASISTFEPSDELVERATSSGETPRDIFAKDIRFALTNGHMYGRYQYSRERVEIFRDAVRFAHARGIELHVAICPVHVTQLETIRAAGLWEQFEDWKRDLVQVMAEANQADSRRTALWDFSGYTSFPAEPTPSPHSRTSLRYYIESSHFTRVLGDEMLARMLTPDRGDPEFGVLLSENNVEHQLARVREDRRGWSSSNASDVEWVERIALECGYSPSPLRMANEGTSAAKQTR